MKKLHDRMGFVSWTKTDNNFMYFDIYKVNYFKKKDAFLNLGFGKIKNLQLS